MAESFKGVIDIDIRDSVPDWSPYLQPVAPADAPNVVYIVLDDGDVVFDLSRLLILDVTGVHALHRVDSSWRSAVAV